MRMKGMNRAKEKPTWMSRRFAGEKIRTSGCGESDEAGWEKHWQSVTPPTGMVLDSGMGMGAGSRRCNRGWLLQPWQVGKTPSRESGVRHCERLIRLKEGLKQNLKERNDRLWPVTIKVTPLPCRPYPLRAHSQHVPLLCPILLPHTE